VVSGHDDAAISGKSGEDRERGRAIEPIIGIDVGYVLVWLRICRHFHVAVEAEHLPDGYLDVRQWRGKFGCHQSSVREAPAIPDGRKGIRGPQHTLGPE